MFRFKSRDGKGYFFAEGSSMAFDENDIDTTISFQSEPVESIAEGIKKLISDFQIFFVLPTFVHPEYRADVKSHLENLYANLTEEESIKLQRAGDFARKPEEWLREAEWRMERNARRDEKKNKKEIDDAKPQCDKHFLLYWQEANVAAHQESGYPLDVVSSRQLKRAKAGDTLWLVTINQVGELILAGKLRAGEIVDYQTAIRKLNDTSLWDGGFFALPKENEAEFLRRISLGETALDLRFANSERDCFVLKNGKINPQQLQTMRELTENSAEMLARIWETEEAKDADFTNGSDELGEEENWVELLEHFQLLVREQPDAADAHYNLGVAYGENDLPEEATAAYQKAIELDPDYLGAYYNLGQNQLRSGELDKSEQSFKDAIRLAPEFAPARFMLGVVYGGLGDFEKAIRTTKEGLQHAPDDPMAHFNIGNFYSHLRDYEKAAEWFEKSAEIDPNAPDTFYRLGKCYKELGEKKMEFDAYLDAVELAPDFVDALFALGTVYAHLSKTEEGERVAYFETGGELILSDPRVSFYVGLGNLALGNVDDARESQEDLLKMDESLAKELQFFINRFNAETNEDSAEFDLRWLEPEESGFAIRVLDCRPFTETQISFSMEEQNALTFISTRDSSGEQHRGKSPENAKSLSCDLSYPINAFVPSPILNSPPETRDLPEGKLFSAAEMEEKWDVYYFDNYFYFVRNWTDKIAYRARAEEEGLYLYITEIEYDGEKSEEKDYHLRAVDYLLKTFVIELTVPHPVPADIENTPESSTLFSFSFAGRHAKFASFEDTISAIPALQKSADKNKFFKPVGE